MKQRSKVVWPGFSYTPAPRRVLEVGRNEPCPCDSGKKYKECHEVDGPKWLEKFARQQEKKRYEAEHGRPWYKRLFGIGG